MSARAAYLAVTSIASAAGVVALLRAAVGSVLEAPPLSPTPAARAATELPRAYPADSLGRVLVGRDPFRFGRRAAGVAYDPTRGPGGVETVTNALPKPTLLLIGLVGGHEPTAVIEGFPGTDAARVVRVGDVVAGLRVQSIGRAQVRIVGMDTTWVLKVREPWR